ncbi:S24 family peptidase [Pseudooceanicola algae]|uniref:Uncharacterized protein n=1 Tax=Pseudooceanicola algae TaxID=1537215 RepID=A0A418SDR1_9RHOB|nr:S24 family peptidase [Pseudooceanicola algae]QPM89361.1 hypothetical protein PSAL_005770 [Pseudooceanicola algae]
MAPLIGIYSYISKDYFPIADFVPSAQYRAVSDDPFIIGLRAIFAERPDLKPATVSTEAGLDKSAIRKMLDGSVKSPKISNAVKIASILGTTIEEIVGDPQTVWIEKPHASLAGNVGAGAQVPVFEAYPNGSGPKVPLPPGLKRTDVIAVRIEGDSMEPVYSAGDLLFYHRETADGVPAESIGHRCVCEDANGMGWVKQIKLGSQPGLYNLVSLNPGATNMHDVELKWAARVLLHWPAELVAPFEHGQSQYQHQITSENQSR